MAGAQALLAIPLMLLGSLVMSVYQPASASPDETLLEAAQRGDLVAVDRAIRRGAPVESTDSAGLTALMIASRAGHADVVSRLLDAGAKIDRRGPGAAGTALTQAAAQAKQDVLRLLLQRGADPNAVSADGYGVLWYAVLSAEGGMEPVQDLLEAGADPDHRAPTAETALTLAMSLGRGEIVQLLLDAAADAEIDDD